MGNILLIIVGPLLAVAVLAVALARARSRRLLASLALLYLTINVAAPLAYGMHAFPEVREDMGECASLIGLVLVARRIDLFGLKLWAAFSVKWAHAR